MDFLGNTEALVQYLLVIRRTQKQLDVHASPRVDGLIIVSGKVGFLGGLHQTADHGPLQRRQVLRFVHDQQFQPWCLSNLKELYQHIGEV